METKLCRHGEPFDTAPDWCLEEEEDEMTEEDKQVNLFGVMTNFMMPDENTPTFSLEARVWKGLWDFKTYESPQELKVTSTHGYRLNNWHDDIDGGPGLCIVVDFDSPRGKAYNAQVIIPKDELIKALGLLVGDGTE